MKIPFIYRIPALRSLTGKFALAVAIMAICAMVVLTVLVARRETGLLVTEGRRQAALLASTISTALSDNMLEGRPMSTRRLVNELRANPQVEDITILKPNGNPAFGLDMSGFRIHMDVIPDLKSERTFYDRDSLYLLKPLENRETCSSCHVEAGPRIGVLGVKLSSRPVTENLIGLGWRMALFALLSAGALSFVVIWLGRRMLIKPVQGLTETSKKITQGRYELYRPRGSGCYEMVNCGNTACPSYDDHNLPCWLRGDTFCASQRASEENVPEGERCRSCIVRQRLEGDELDTLIDNFNRMSLTLSENREEARRHIEETEAMNRQLSKNNTKLTTLLEALRLTTSTLELERILENSLRIVLEATQLTAGIVLLLEEEASESCHEFFDCTAYNCPAYRSEVNCWTLSGTMCHGSQLQCPHGETAIECWGKRGIHSHHLAARSYEEKITGCSGCRFFMNRVLIPRMSAGVTIEEDSRVGIKVDSRTIQSALFMGRALVNHRPESPLPLPFEAATELAMPLKSHDEVIGILYLASEQSLIYGEEEVEFFQLLAEAISAGIFNSRVFDDVKQSYLQTVLSLSNAIEAKDEYTRGHSERVARLSLLIADRLHMSRQERDHLRFAAILHDIGKIGLSRLILNKPRILERHELLEVRDHPTRGARILEPVHFLKPCLSAIRHHHERLDGTGYPDGLSGTDIPLKARIIAVADAWDAMGSHRPYRDPLPIGTCVAEMRKNAGTQFDPRIVEILIDIVGNAKRYCPEHGLEL